MPLIGMGCMRLSTERDRDEARAVEVLHAALDAGVTFLDTADAYCWDDTEAGHNERLIARALAAWSGDRSRILVATKGGLTRPNGRWVADGRARHLVSACEASRRALGVERIHLYQLHVPDPRVPISTSVRALASLQRDGLVRHIGLCNVNIGQIEEARRIAEIDAVQVELNVWNDDNVLSGVAEYCVTHAIRLVAHRPLGGAQRIRRTASDALLVDLGARHDATALDIAIAWLMDLSDVIVPIPGPTRVVTAASLGRARQIQLTDEDRARLDDRFPAGKILRRRATPGREPREPIAPREPREPIAPREPREPIAPREPPEPIELREPSDPREPRELVLIMGLPAAGKSTAARSFVEQGFARVNRDLEGGSLRELLPAVDRLIESGHGRIVLDNTYVSRKSRQALIQLAARHGLPVRCVWLSTSLEEAQVNAAWRMVSTFGRLLEPEELRRAAKQDVVAFGPGVQFRYQRELETPDPSEGFSRIDTVPFERTRDPGFTNRAVIVWCDGVLGRTRLATRDAGAVFVREVSAEEGEVFAERGKVLQRYAADGWRLLGLDWQPGIAEEVVTREQVEAGLRGMQDRLGIKMDIVYCPHGPGPPVCWCRKPLPGLGVVLIQRYLLDPSQCIYVGAGPQDPGFSRRLGFVYRDAADFFAVAER